MPISNQPDKVPDFYNKSKYSNNFLLHNKKYDAKSNIINGPIRTVNNCLESAAIL